MQIPVAEPDIRKIAVITPFDLCELKFMPSDLKNGGSILKRYRDTIFANVKNVHIYMNDALISSEYIEEHISVLRDYKFCVSIEK